MTGAAASELATFIDESWQLSKRRIYLNLLANGNAFLENPATRNTHTAAQSCRDKEDSSHPESRSNIHSRLNVPCRSEKNVLPVAVWPILRLAATHSEQSYDKKRPKPTYNEDVALERVNIQSEHVDPYGLIIVVAIRGTGTWKDWMVNLMNGPSNPRDVLDDLDNACHKGFLRVFRRLSLPLAARLEAFRSQQKDIQEPVLLFTGHSAGGAIASLFYAHMETRTIDSHLTKLARKFSCLHCITFGSPPISLQPLSQHSRSNSIFISVLNQGDPVVKADKAFLNNMWQIPISTPALFYPADIHGLDERLHQPSQVLSDTLRDKEFINHTNATIIQPPAKRLFVNSGTLLFIYEKKRHGVQRRPSELCVNIVNNKYLDRIPPGWRWAMHRMVVYRQRIHILASELG